MANGSYSGIMYGSVYTVLVIQVCIMGWEEYPWSLVERVWHGSSGYNRATEQGNFEVKGRDWDEEMYDCVGWDNFSKRVSKVCE